MWITRDADDLLVSTLEGSRKARNVRHDPRVSISVYDLTNPLTHAEFRGTAELAVDEDRTVVNTIANKYLGTDSPTTSPTPPAWSSACAWTRSSATPGRPYRRVRSGRTG